MADNLKGQGGKAIPPPRRIRKADRAHVWRLMVEEVDAATLKATSGTQTFLFFHDARKAMNRHQLRLYRASGSLLRWRVGINRISQQPWQQLKLREAKGYWE